MSYKASGTFEVKLTPQPSDGYFDGSALNRLTIDKQFQGDLEATSKGQMMSAVTAIQGSAGYVAIELITGILLGRSGSFVLQHSSTMNKGQPQQSIQVVPDSGTDQLRGLRGSMTISRADGQHRYDLEFELDD